MRNDVENVIMGIMGIKLLVKNIHDIPLQK